MKRFYKMLLALVLVLCVKNSSVVFAQQSPFETEFVVEYSLNEYGEASVTQDVSIVNKEKDAVATTYSLTVNGMQIYEIQGFEGSKEIPLDVNLDNDKTVLKTEFKDFVIGEGQKKDIRLTYKTKDIAANVGQVWNINIPKIATSDLTRAYDIKLIVPKSFGEKIYLSPAPLIEERSDLNTTYIFNKDLINNVGVNGSFGNYQRLNFKINYDLENNSKFAVTKNIALPPDLIGRQQVTFKSLKPKPKEITIDGDGNYLAYYNIKSGEHLSIELAGWVEITGNQINPSLGGSFNDIPKELIQKYTSEKKYWETNAPDISFTAKELYDTNLNVSENAQKIYNYIISTLNYNFEIGESTYIERSGAKKAINESSVACMEYTDLFIALARSMGIPAREINGYAYAEDTRKTPLSISLDGGDVLHAWAEYYDPNFGWIGIDPTWGSTSGNDYFTKLDTNHFAFVIKGLDSEYPLPAGMYKINSSQKQLEIDFAQDSATQPKIELKLFKTLELNPLNYFKHKSTYLVENTGETTLFNLNNEGITLVPSMRTRLTLDISNTKILYEQFNGVVTSYEVAPTQIQSYDLKHDSVFTYFLILLVALVLCTMFYFVANRLWGLKK